MKLIMFGMFLILAVLTASPAAIGSADTIPADPPSGWNRFWQGVVEDWKKIGKNAKQSGTEAGRTVKEEFQELPGNLRKGFEKAKDDFNNSAVAPEESRTEK